RGPPPQRPRPRLRVRQRAGAAGVRGRVVPLRSPPGVRGPWEAAAGPRAARPARGGVPGWVGHRCPEGAGDGDHRRAGADRPRVGPDLARLVRRPFPTSATYRNLLAHPEGVLHVTDDALLLAKAALGAAGPLPPLRPAERVGGFVLADCCRHYEFAVRDVDA